MTQTFNNERVAVVFSGLNGKLAGATEPTARRVLLGHGWETIWLTDVHKIAFLGGCDQHPGPGVLERFLEKLRDEAAEVITIGWSAGGMGAVKYGSMMGANHIVAYSPFLARDDKSLLDDGRAMKRQDAIRQAEPVDARRNARYFMDTTGFSNPVHIYYPGLSAADSYQANVLSGYANVALHPQESVNHRFLVDLKMSFKQHWALVEQDLKISAG